MKPQTRQLFDDDDVIPAVVRDEAARMEKKILQNRSAREGERVNMPDTIAASPFPCPECAVLVGTVVVLDAAGAPLWYRCRACGLGWDVGIPIQPSLFSSEVTA